MDKESLSLDLVAAQVLMIGETTPQVRGEVAGIEFADKYFAEAGKDFSRVGGKRIDEIEMRETHLEPFLSGLIYGAEDMAVGAAPADYELFSIRVSADNPSSEDF